MKKNNVRDDFQEISRNQQKLETLVNNRQKIRNVPASVFWSFIT